MRWETISERNGIIVPTEDLILMIGIILLFVIVGGFAALKNQQKKKIADLILISKVYSVSRIAKLARIGEDKAIRRIQQLISYANDGNREWRVLRGAHLDLNTLEIILAEVDEADEALTLEGLVNQAKKVVHSKLAQHLPEEQKEPWTCPYCRTVNDGEEQVCNSCKANR